MRRNVESEQETIDALLMPETRDINGVLSSRTIAKVRLDMATGEKDITMTQTDFSVLLEGLLQAFCVHRTNIRLFSPNTTMINSKTMNDISCFSERAVYALIEHAR